MCLCVCVSVCVCVPCTAVILFSKAEPGLGPSLALKDNNRRSIPVRVRMYVCVCVLYNGRPTVAQPALCVGRGSTLGSRLMNCQ